MEFKLKYIRNGMEHTQDGLREVADGGRTRYEAEGIAVEHEFRKYEDGLEEYRLLVKNTGSQPLDIVRAFPFSKRLDVSGSEMEYFGSGWSEEYILASEPVKPMVLQNEKGRSSLGFFPKLFFKRDGNYRAAVAVAWSGNWKIEVEQEGQEFLVSAGITDVNFCKTVNPGQVFDSFRVLAVTPGDGTLDGISRAFASWHRKYNSPKNEEAYKLPVEWNHWWPYEDGDIDENIFKANADAAGEIGCEICVLDAGWFGAGAFWYEVRGDWEEVNTGRFPSGIRSLSDYVHSRGMKFGIWCEIEALGAESSLGKRHPEFAALRDGGPLRYVCLGNKEAWNWAFSTLENMIADYNADWFKIDFNLDPGYGCNRTDHGHGAGDGLYEHYRGLYSLVDAIRAKYPHVIMEACSSGGLRIDHEILHHFDFHFLSDSDETAKKVKFYHHNLAVLPPEACLHWAWSDTRTGGKGERAFPGFTPWDPQFAAWQVDTHIRIGMLGAFGLSHRLNLFDQRLKDIFARHISFYKNHVREFIRSGVVYKLIPGEFVAEIDLYAVQYSLEEQERHLVFVFAKTAQKVVLRLKGLNPEKPYKVEITDESEKTVRSGKVLMEEGMELVKFRPWESRILLLNRE